MTKRRTIIIGDSHSEANENQRRFAALGNFLVEEQFDNWVSIGDFFTLDALSAWDLNKSSKMEGRRLKADLEWAKKAMDLVMAPTLKYNLRQKSKKKRGYYPDKYYLVGNHEDRWPRYLETKSELTEILDPLEVIGVYDHGWYVTPYREYVCVEGTLFTHVPMNGINNPMNKSQNYLYTAAKEHSDPVIWGHTHEFGVQTFTHKGKDSKQVMAINCGCFFEGIPEYARGSSGSRNWWRGLIILEHYGDGTFDIHTKRLDALLREYL